MFVVGLICFCTTGFGNLNDPPCLFSTEVNDTVQSCDGHRCIADTTTGYAGIIRMCMISRPPFYRNCDALNRTLSGQGVCCAHDYCNSFESYYELQAILSSSTSGTVGEVTSSTSGINNVTSRTLVINASPTTGETCFFVSNGIVSEFLGHP